MSKQKESLSISMAKVIMVVAIIVSLGAVLGVAGYVLTKQKCAVQNPPVTQKADETADWKTYRNEEYWFEVKFPSDLVVQKNTGESYISFEGKLAEKSYFLQFGYVSQDALNRMGVSYCGAHLGDDSLCENFTTNNLQFLIDWNIETEGAFTQSRAEIQRPEGGMVVISMLHSPGQDIKLFFRRILSTFRFTEK